MIFNILIFIILGGLLMIIALPLLLLRAFRSRVGRHYTRRQNREGEVTVSGQDAAAGEKIIGDNIGEYVDYEEVDDRKK